MCWSLETICFTRRKSQASYFRSKKKYDECSADSDEVARVYRYEVARGFRDDVAHLSDLISPGGEAF